MNPLYPNIGSNQRPMTPVIIQGRCNFSFKQEIRSAKKLVITSQKKLKLNEIGQSQDMSHTSNLLAQSAVNKETQLNRRQLKNEIDIRLNKAYSSIVKHKSIQLSGRKIQTSNKQQSPFPDIHSTSRTYLKVQNDSVYKELPYELMRKYIQTIYEQYSIKDPLQGIDTFIKNPENLPGSRIQNSSRIIPQTPPRNPMMRNDNDRFSTKKKIFLLKNRICDELGNSTQKKSSQINEFQLRNTTEMLQSNSNQTANFRNSVQSAQRNELQAHGIETQLNKRYNEKFSCFNNRIEHIGMGISSINNINQNLTQTKFSISQVNQSTFNSIHHPFNSSRAYSAVQNSRKLQNEVKKIDQIYRYCFVCQQPILQANISYHEKTCKGLNQILYKSRFRKEQFVEMMDVKILRIQKQLLQNMHQSSVQQTASKLKQLKQKVFGWISTINKESGQNKFNSFNDTLNEQKKIESLIQSTKLKTTFQLINKLKWFVHLKRNFLFKVQNNPALNVF